MINHRRTAVLSRLPVLLRIIFRPNFIYLNFISLTVFSTSASHLLYVSIDVSFPAFGEERCPGGEVLLELGVGLLLAAVAAAGGAAPGQLEGGGFLRAVGLVFHHDYS